MSRAKIGFYAAFGVPAFLLVVSTVVFWLGTPTYRIVEPGSNIFAVLFKLVKDARQERALQQSAVCAAVLYFAYDATKGGGY